MTSPRLIRIPARLRRPDLIRRLPLNANFRDRTGDRANGCLVMGYAGILQPGFSAWLCRCECGTLFITRSANLNKDRTSCGCRQSSHKQSGTAMYFTWRHMVNACHNPDVPAYGRYGKRGIKVCMRWRDSVQRFAQDMGPRKPGEVLDRINPSGNFTPANCRWATRSEFIANNRRRIVIECQGERLGVREWAKRLGMSPQGVWYRLAKCRELGADLSEAVATPAGEKMACIRPRMEGAVRPRESNSHGTSAR